MRAIALHNGLLINLPFVTKSEFFKRFDTQNMDQNADGNIIWNRKNGIRYIWKLYFNGITTQEKETLKKIFEDATVGALNYYPDINKINSYSVFVNCTFDFQELFIKGSGRWVGIMELIGEKLVDERGDVANYYSDDFLIDTATSTEFSEKYPKWVRNSMNVTTENSLLICPYEIRQIYEDFTNYNNDTACFNFYNIKTTYWNSDSYYILTDLWFNINTYVNILYWPKIKNMEMQIRENGTYIIDNNIQLDSQIDYDCRIVREGNKFTAYYRVLGTANWIEIGSGSFSQQHILNRVRIGDNRVAFTLDKFEVNPDYPRPV